MRFLIITLLIGIASNAIAAAKPNVIVLMADDIGFECYSCYGSEFYQTPHIDTLAKGGAKFTQAYSNPVCTPSRVKIMSGKYNIQNYKSFGQLDLEQRTFAHMVKDAGYKTAIAGKWQLSPANLKGPFEAGFDEYMLWHFAAIKSNTAKEKAAFKSKGSRFKSPMLFHNENPVEQTENKYGPDLVSDYICDFIERNKQDPFLVYYPMILVHNPFDPTPDSPDWEKKDKSRGGLEHFRDMVHYMDKIVGKLVAKLDETGLRENTLIVVTGDNGTNTGITSPYPLRPEGYIKGGKGSIQDAGNRVGFVASWPGTIQAGTVVDAPVDFADILPTIADTTGATIPKDAVGESWLPLAKGGDTKQARGWIFQSYNKGKNEPDSSFQCFVRDADWKLYADGRLFNVPNDWLEENPISSPESAPHRERFSQIMKQVLNDIPPEKVRRTSPGSKPKKKKASKSQ